MLFTRDSQHVIAYSTNSRIHVFNLGTGDKVAEWNAHSGQLGDYALHPKNRTLITVGYRGHVRIWDYLTGDLLNELIDPSLPDEPINAVDINNDGTRLISAHKSGRVNFWNLIDNSKELSFDLHRSSVSKAKLASELRSAVTGGWGIRVWNTLNGQEYFELKNRFLLSVSPDGTRFLTRTNASNASFIDMYSTAEGKKIATLYGHKGVIIDAGFLPQNEGIWSTGRDGTAIIWKRVSN